MPEIITTELKSDLERIYKIAGDLLNNIEIWKKDNKEGSTHQLLEQISFKLMDISGTLQKDIFNCDYLVTKIRTTGGGEFDWQKGLDRGY